MKRKTALFFCWLCFRSLSTHRALQLSTTLCLSLHRIPHLASSRRTRRAWSTSRPEPLQTGKGWKREEVGGKLLLGLALNFEALFFRQTFVESKRGARGGVSLSSSSKLPNFPCSLPHLNFHFSSFRFSLSLSLPFRAFAAPAALQLSAQARRCNKKKHPLPTPKQKCPSSAGRRSPRPAPPAPAAAMIRPSRRSGLRASATPRAGCSTRPLRRLARSGSGRAGRRRGEFRRGERRKKKKGMRGAIDDFLSWLTLFIKIRKKNVFF